MTAKISSVRALCYRYALTTPVETSFGRMSDRPAVFVRVEDSDGCIGWGEAWSNFPAPGAEHRARLLNEVLAPAVEGLTVTDPARLFQQLTANFAVLALQSGESGPFAQCIAAIDLAMWDLAARKKSLPLWRLIGGEQPEIKVYASGINPTGARLTAEKALRAGHRALKLKIGFDPARDRANLAGLREVAGNGFLAADVNQGWTPEQALELAPAIDDFGLGWLEEPLRADLPWPVWRKLKERMRTPLAGGENISGHEDFSRALEADVLAVVQPDAAKWGGISGCAEVAWAVIAAGKTYCPHYLGGGIGLLASAHLLAAVGGDGRLEIDINDNPLRDALCGPVANVREGTIRLTDEPGLGIAPDLAPIERYRTA